MVVRAPQNDEGTTTTDLVNIQKDLGKTTLRHGDGEKRYDGETLAGNFRVISGPLVNDSGPGVESQSVINLSTGKWSKV